MDFLLIALLTLLNGAFAMSELALASSRKARLTAMAEAGDRGAQAALALLNNPTQFLSSVQVGITSIGIVNGIIGEAAFAADVAAVLSGWGMSATASAITATAATSAEATSAAGYRPGRVSYLSPPASDSPFPTLPISYVSHSSDLPRLPLFQSHPFPNFPSRLTPEASDRPGPRVRTQPATSAQRWFLEGRDLP